MLELYSLKKPFSYLWSLKKSTLQYPKHLCISQCREWPCSAGWGECSVTAKSSMLWFQATSPSQHRILCVRIEVIVARRGMDRENIQLIHLRSWVHDHQLVLGNVCGSCCKVGDRFTLYALKVYMPTLSFFLLPRHSNKGPLDIVVNHFWAAPRPFLYFFFVGWITFYSQSNLLKTPLLQNWFGHISVFNVLEKSI